VVAGGGDGMSPTVMRAFTNRDDIDFGMAAELAPVQEFTLVEDSTASLEYGTRITKFQSVSSLTLYFRGGEPRTRIHFVGLRGQVWRNCGDVCSAPFERHADALRHSRSQGSGLKREAPLNIVYEAKPQPQDHKVGGATTLGARMLQ